MNFGTFAVILILTVFVILDIRYLIRSGRNACAGDCGSCHGSCKWSEDLKQAKRDLSREKENSLRKAA